MVAEDLLASWRDTPTRKAVIGFCRRTSRRRGRTGFAVPAERVAVFDNDGTLWSEKPIPIQLDFTLVPHGRTGAGGPCARWTAAVQVGR